MVHAKHIGPVRMVTETSEAQVLGKTNRQSKPTEVDKSLKKKKLPTSVIYRWVRTISNSISNNEPHDMTTTTA